MTTECTTERLEFGGLRRQRVVGRFDGGELSSDGGGLLLRELAQRTGLSGRSGRGRRRGCSRTSAKDLGYQLVPDTAFPTIRGPISAPTA